MIGLLFLIILAWQFYIGYSRGIILQAYYFVASVLSLFVAGCFYQSFSEALTLWVPFVNPAPDARVNFFTAVNIFELDRVFYAGTAFLILYLFSYTIFRLLGIFFHLIDLEKYDKPISNSISGVLSVFLTTLCLSMGTTIFATIPVVAVQEFIANHVTTKVLISFPFLSELWYHLWVGKIL